MGCFLYCDKCEEYQSNKENLKKCKIDGITYDLCKSCTQEVIGFIGKRTRDKNIKKLKQKWDNIV